MYKLPSSATREGYQQVVVVGWVGGVTCGNSSDHDYNDDDDEEEENTTHIILQQNLNLRG